MASLSEIEGPAKECERLSKELSRQIASHTRERDTLKNRIEQLRSENELLRGDHEQLEINCQLIEHQHDALQQPTEDKKAA